MSTFHFTIITPSEKIFEGDVDSASIPGGDGVLSVLPNHSTLITTTVPGEVVITQDKKEQKIHIESSGVFEFHSDNTAVIIVNT